MTKFGLLVFMACLLAFISCDSDKEQGDNIVVHNNGDKEEKDGVVVGDSQIEYSGITEVDETMRFRSLDPDDWRDDGILTECFAYPNPIRLEQGRIQFLTVKYKLLAPANVAIIIRDSNKEIVPQIRAREEVELERSVFTFADDKHRADKLNRVLSQSIRLEMLDLNIDENNWIPLPPGIYRLFIYASDSDLMRTTLRQTGETNTPRDKYSLVYGDILVIE